MLLFQSAVVPNIFPWLNFVFKPAFSTAKRPQATAAVLQILVTELGDETFIIAAIMAMRHPRLVVYVGAMSALVSMTVRCENLVPAW